MLKRSPIRKLTAPHDEAQGYMKRISTRQFHHREKKYLNVPII